MSDSLAQLERELRSSRKYRHLSPDTLVRVLHWAQSRFRNPREIVKAAKRKLHQVFAAYCLPEHLDHLCNEVELLPPITDAEAHRAACRELLRRHVSTAERLAAMDSLYLRLWNETGVPRSVLDLACGYHPFALPWMALDQSEYHCCDIDQRLVSAVNAYLTRLHRPASATCQDILAGVPKVAVDVALLLKLAPCLEQQEQGAAIRVLRAVQARHAVVSFPLESLGGKGKGMREHYARFMAEIAAALRAPVRSVEYENEVFYVLDLSSS